MWRIAVVDDDPTYRHTLTEYLRSYFADREAYECVVFEDGTDFLARQTSGLDLLFLDIVMDRSNGVEVARAVRERDENVAIVFVTEAVQYALEGYGVRASDFLVKPLYYTSFKTCMQRVLAQVGRRKPTMLRVDYDKTVHYLDAASITYIETQGKRVVIHAQSGDYPCSDTMKDLEARLAPFGFARCHHACIVNAAYVETVRKNDALVCGTWVPISRQRRDAFMTFLLREIGGAV